MNKITDISLSHNSVISLHVQLHNQLRQLVLSGSWPHASRIPSESEFARHLKISRGTVRLALQQAEIEGLIERIAGRGTFVAYQPATQHESRLIAFVTRGFDAGSTLLLLSGVESEAKDRGYQVIFSNPQNYHEEIEILQRLPRANVVGAVLWPHADASKPQEQNVTNYHQIRIPVVLMDREIYGCDYDCVTSDHYYGAQALIRHLIELGHRQIVFMSHYETQLISVVERYRAYCDVMQEAGLTPADIWLIGRPGDEISASDTLRSSVDIKSPMLQQIKNHMLAANPRPTAIFALNDYISVLAIRAMKLLNLRVPDDISIAGFDDTDIVAHLEVPLTTVAQDSFTIGRRATQRLINRLEGYSGPAERDIVPTQLRIRSSTAMPVRV